MPLYLVRWTRAHTFKSFNSLLAQYLTSVYSGVGIESISEFLDFMWSKIVFFFSSALYHVPYVAYRCICVCVCWFVGFSRDIQSPHSTLQVIISWWWLLWFGFFFGLSTDKFPNILNLTAAALSIRFLDRQSVISNFRTIARNGCVRCFHIKYEFDVVRQQFSIMMKRYVLHTQTHTDTFSEWWRTRAHRNNVLFIFSKWQNFTLAASRLSFYLSLSSSFFKFYCGCARFPLLTTAADVNGWKQSTTI